MGGEVYARMHRSSWFSAHGQWSRWDALDRMGALDVPVLAIGGVDDQCVPALTQRSRPDAEAVALQTGHMPFLERPEEYLEVLRGFLSQTEASYRGWPAGSRRPPALRTPQPKLALPPRCNGRKAPVSPVYR